MENLRRFLKKCAGKFEKISEKMLEFFGENFAKIEKNLGKFEKIFRKFEKLLRKFKRFSLKICLDGNG